MTTPSFRFDLVDDPQAVAETGARWVVQRIQAALDEKGVCFLALAGGETPRGCYERLAAPPLRDRVDWSKVHVFWSDERLVPLSDPASNHRMAREALLDRVAVPPDHIIPAPVELADPERVAEQYARALDRVPTGAGGWPRFDLILLGLGEDGHTASLFPGDPVLEERTARVRAVLAAKPPPERITFTLPLIDAARMVLFLVQGGGKREALTRVLRHDPQTPAARVQPADGDLGLIADLAAAGRV